MIDATAFRYALVGVAVLSCLLNLLVLRVALDLLGLDAVLFQALAVLSYALGFFLLNRHVVFVRPLH